ncbi:MAG: HEAT repeat domain-containing protein [Coleofasciculaceae cyanobacterium]
MSVALKILLLNSLLLFMSSSAWSEERQQNCTQAQIQANIDKFKSSDYSVTMTAINAVANCKSLSVKPLIEALNAQSAQVRRNAVKALGDIGAEDKAKPQLIQSLIAKFKDSNESVRETAIHVVVVKYQPEWIKPLIEALNNQSDGIRENAAKALAQIASNPEIVPTEAIPQLIQSLQQDNNSSVRMYAAMAIAAIGESAKAAIPQLIQSLKQDQHFAVRTYAAGAFIYMGESGKEAIPQLIQSLKQDPDATVRSAAAFALGYMKESAKEAIPQLIQSLKQDPDSGVRSAAASTLDHLKVDPK